jgi:hypothetical protein
MVIRARTAGPIAHFLDLDLATRRFNSLFGIKERPETPSELSPRVLTEVPLRGVRHGLPAPI